VLGKPINEIAKRVVEHIRLPLLSADELKEVDEECQKDKLIAVSTEALVIFFFSVGLAIR